MRTRVISAVVLGFVTTLAGLMGGWWFSGLILLIVVIATYEVIQLMRASGFMPSLVFSVCRDVAGLPDGAPAFLLGPIGPS